MVRKDRVRGEKKKTSNYNEARKKLGLHRKPSTLCRRSRPEFRFFLNFLVDPKAKLSNYALRSKLGDLLRAVSQLAQPAIGVLREFWRWTLRPDRIVHELNSSTRNVLRAIGVPETRDKIAFLQVGMSQNFRNTQDAAGRDACRYHQRLPFRRSPGGERMFHFPIDACAIFSAKLPVAKTGVCL